MENTIIELEVFQSMDKPNRYSMSYIRWTEDDDSLTWHGVRLTKNDVEELCKWITKVKQKSDLSEEVIIRDID